MTSQTDNKHFPSPALRSSDKFIVLLGPYMKQMKDKKFTAAVAKPAASAINSCVITNNGMCQRCLSYLTGRFDNGLLSVEMSGEIFTTATIHKGIRGQPPTRTVLYQTKVPTVRRKVFNGKARCSIL